MSTLVRGAVLIDGTGAQPTADTAILIDGERIVAIGREGRVPSNAEAARVIDVTGKVVIPGLIDAHVHVLGGSTMAYLDELDLTLLGAHNGSQMLKAGITAARDAGARSRGIFALKRAMQRHWVDGPSLVVAGQAICMTGGHGHKGVSVEADGVEEVRKVTRRQLKAGADFVKIMATGGAGTPGERATSVQLTKEEIQVAVDEAHRAGKPVAVHALAAEGVKNALRAGADSIEHGAFLDEEAIDMMLERDAFYVPTLSVYKRIVERADALHLPDYMVDKSKEVVDKHMQSCQAAVEAGVPIVCGTDCGGAYHPPGDIVIEFELLTDCGLSSAQAIVSGTRAAAQLLGIGTDTGTLEVGKFADLVVLSSDPLEDIRALGEVELVMKAGDALFSAIEPSSGQTFET